MRSAMALVCLLLTTALTLAAPERYTLSNGATIILNQVSGAEIVGIVAAYDTGFLDDPAGLPQAAHLAEHLRCTGATQSWGAGVSFARLNELGGANAETLASLTYYDTILPSSHLELALRVETERLSSLRITNDDIAREGPRAAAELTAVDTHPKRFVGKFALMALAQGWNHNATHVNLQTALGQAPIGALRPSLARHAPESLTLLVVGDFDIDTAKRHITDTLGVLAKTQPPPPAPPIDWSAQPDRREMTWDASTRVVAIACDVPDDPAQRAVLTGLGAVALMTCNSVPGVLSLHTSGRTAPVGPTPFHVLAAIEDEANPDEVIEALHERLDAIVSDAAMYRAQLRPMFSGAPRVSADRMRTQAQAIARMRSIDESRAMGMALINTGLDGLLRDASASPATRDAVRRLSAEQWREIASELLARDQRRVTVLSPRTRANRP